MLLMGGTNVTSVIICETVREETGGKLSAVGIIPGTITVPQFPANILLSFLLVGEVVQLGSFNVTFRLTGAGEPNAFAQLQVTARLEELGPSATGTPPMIVPCGSEGDILLEMQMPDGSWIEALRRRAIQGL